MKVLHVIPSVSPVHGGPSRAIVDIERALATCGIHVTTVTTNDNGRGRRLAVQCGKPVETGYATRWYFPLNSGLYKVSLWLGWWLHRNIGDFDVVHAHALFSFAPVAAALLARRRRLPYVLRPLGILSRYGISSHRSFMKRLSLTVLERPLIEAASAIHFTSLAEQSEAESLGLKCKGVVIPLGIDTESLPTADAQLRWDSSSILFLSRIDPKKNLEGLLHALPLVLAKHSSVKLIIAGDGEPAYVNRLKALVHELGIAEHVNWSGYVEGDRKARILATATAFVLASYSENFGIAAVEALAAGLPCIVSEDVALSHEIAAAQAGVIAGTDPTSIAAAILATLDSRSGYEAMSVAARHLATSRFSMETMGARLEALYRGIAAPEAKRRTAAVTELR